MPHSMNLRRVLGELKRKIWFTPPSLKTTAPTRANQLHLYWPCGVMVARLTTNQEVVVSSTTSVMFFSSIPSDKVGGCFQYLYNDKTTGQDGISTTFVWRTYLDIGLPSPT